MKFVQAGMIVALLTLVSTVQASLITPTGSTLLAESNFRGRITSIDIDPAAGGSLIGGVVVGSAFEGSFALVEEADIPELFFMSEYTFYGPSDDYSFTIEGGYSSFWGSIDMSGDTLGVGWNNNFDSDGLEDTFVHPQNRSDFGFFDVDFFNYDSGLMSGLGSFGWDGVTINFELGSPVSVPAPSPLVFLFGAFFVLVYKRRVSAS